MTTATEVKLEDGEHLTKADQYRREVSAELAGAMEELKDRKRVWDDLKTDTKEAKADVEAAQREVNRLADELRGIEHGTYQPRLVPQPATNGKPKDAQATASPTQATGSDEAASTLINALTEFDLTDGARVTPKVCELLQQSKFEIKTIGDLERTIRENEWWHRDCSGIGPKGIDKIVEALAAFRRQHPMPSPDDPQPAEQGEVVDAEFEVTNDTQPDSDGDAPEAPSDVPM